MEEKGLPPELRQPFSEQYERLLESYRDIDCTFIERGFILVKAYIDHGEALCGPGNYERFVYQQTHQNRIDEWRSIDDQLFKEMVEYENRGERPPLEYVEKIWSHPVLECGAKAFLVGRFFREQFDAAMAKYEPMLRAAQQAEQRTLCRLWCEREPMRLIAADTIELRKEVINSVMADAFVALAFEKRNRRRGVDIYFEPLTDRYAIVVTCNRVSLEHSSPDYGPEHDQPGKGASLDWLVYLGSSKKTDNTNWFYFTPVFRTYASGYVRYTDTRSLEVCVRAKALMYELTTAPFEELVRKHG